MSLDSDDTNGSASLDTSSDGGELKDELERYLSTGWIKSVDDPLAWWYENRTSYPRLWRMARDYHTIPGMFVYFYFSGTRAIVLTSTCQLRLLLSSAYSAKAISSESLTSVTVYQLSQLVL